MRTATIKIVEKLQGLDKITKLHRINDDSLNLHELLPLLPGGTDCGLLFRLVVSQRLDLMRLETKICRYFLHLGHSFVSNLFCFLFSH